MEFLISSVMGTSLEVKNSMSTAFRTWSGILVEFCMWHVAPFLCSPSQVYLLGLNDDRKRSLLYVSGFSPPERPMLENGLNSAAFMKRAHAGEFTPGTGVANEGGWAV